LRKSICWKDGRSRPLFNGDTAGARDAIGSARSLAAKSHDLVYTTPVTIAAGRMVTACLRAASEIVCEPEVDKRSCGRFSTGSDRSALTMTRQLTIFSPPNPLKQNALAKPRRRRAIDFSICRCTVLAGPSLRRAPADSSLPTEYFYHARTPAQAQKRPEPAGKNQPFPGIKNAQNKIQGNEPQK